MIKIELEEGKVVLSKMVTSISELPQALNKDWTEFLDYENGRYLLKKITGTRMLKVDEKEITKEEALSLLRNMAEKRGHKVWDSKQKLAS